MKKAVESDDVNRHHEDRAARVKGFGKEGFCFLVFVDGFDDIEDIVLVRGVMTIPVFIIKSPKGWHDWCTKGF